MTKTTYYTVTTYLQSLPLKSLKSSLQFFTKATQCMFLAKLIVYYNYFTAQWLILLFCSRYRNVELKALVGSSCIPDSSFWYVINAIDNTIAKWHCLYLSLVWRYLVHAYHLNKLIFEIYVESMWGSSDLDLIGSLSWLLMPWLLASPGYQQPWYWLCEIGRSWSFRRKNSNCLCQVHVDEWHKM